MSTTSPALILEGVHATQGAQTVLRGASLTVGAQETVAIVGAVGSGKSSVIKLCSGILRPDAGKVSTLGQDPAEAITLLAGQLGVLFQLEGLLASMTVRENLSLPLTYHNQVPQEQLEATVLEAMAVADLTADVLDSRPARLSGGQRRRAGLARAWLSGTRLLLLDDLLRGREFASADDFRRFQRQVQARSPAALLLTTQDVRYAAEIADRVVAVVDHDLVELDRTLPARELSALAWGIDT